MSRGRIKRLGQPPTERIVVISDIRSNLEALQEVLSRVPGIDAYCLGDMVGYCANPDEVIEALLAREC